MKRKINVRNIFDKHEEKISIIANGVNVGCGAALVIGKKLGVEKQVASVVLPISIVNISVGIYGLYVALTDE